VIFLNFYEANKINFKKDYYIDTPYPNITVKRLPFEVAVILKRIFAGNKSEMTSIMQYVYQKNILSNVPSLNNLASALEDISVKEMQHYEILSRVMVGANIGPKNCVYIDGNPNLCDYWKASSVCYEKSLVKMFENKTVFILGLARSGFAAAKYLIKHNNEVILNDGKEEEKLDKNQIEELKSLGVKLVFGSHPDDILDESFDTCPIGFPSLRIFLI